MRTPIRNILTAALSVAIWSPAVAISDQDVVRDVLLKTFDKPEMRLTVDPVVIDGDVAVAGWVQGELGGRALLRRKGEAWTIDLCAGDALKESKSLEKLGLQKARADSLAAAIGAAEKKLDPAVLQKFSRFDGMFAVDENGGHVSTDPHHRPIQ
ncbi:copper uptake system-associated protein [Methylocystis parvus]|uniref:Copper uptake system-associated protein n=1 Tax=Methylocystis parvus TaxID=134 RepID=A0A6B8M2E8_9HYPH|nr:copper uptake system-associated protein [Methylocystis parvus]QGM99037.1 copper uptake system-associated protein [Methylocystis parvus]WBK00596.1 copper uptake system-associated protein [Methylocystis parvus OBBP]